jgi:arginase family enzyme
MGPGAGGKSSLTPLINKDPRPLRVIVHNFSDREGSEGSGEQIWQAVKGLGGDVVGESMGPNPKLGDQKKTDRGINYFKAVLEFAQKSAKALEQLVLKYADTDARIFSCGGNHSRAIELIGFINACEVMGKTPVVIWVDAHLDANTPEITPTNNFHGQVVAHLFGRGDADIVGLLRNKDLLKPENFIFVGTASPDEAEADFVENDLKIPPSNIVTASEIRSGQGIEKLQQALNEIRTRLGDQALVAVENDLDVLTPESVTKIVVDNSKRQESRLVEHSSPAKMQNSTGIEFSRLHDINNMVRCAFGKSFIFASATEHDPEGPARQVGAEYSAAIASILRDVPDPGSVAHQAHENESLVVPRRSRAILVGGAIKEWISSVKALTSVAALTTSLFVAGVATRQRSDGPNRQQDVVNAGQLEALKHEIERLRNPNSGDLGFAWTGLSSKCTFKPVWPIGSKSLTDGEVVAEVALEWIAARENGDYENERWRLERLTSVLFVNHLVTNKNPAELAAVALPNNPELQNEVLKKYHRNFTQYLKERDDILSFLSLWDAISEQDLYTLINRGV